MGAAPRARTAHDHRVQTKMLGIRLCWGDRCVVQSAGSSWGPHGGHGSRGSWVVDAPDWEDRARRGNRREAGMQADARRHGGENEASSPCPGDCPARQI